MAPDSNGGVLANNGLAGIAGALRRARAMAEEKFVAIGQGLEASVDILAHLSAAFRKLLVELESDDLKQASQDISAAAAGVSTLSGAHRGERELLGRINDAAVAIEACIARMLKAVKGAGVLGVSAKIEAMHIGDAGADFLGFASEIERSLRLAQENLASLAQEITGVRGHLEQASTGEREFDKRYAEALRLLPARLASSVDAIAAHHTQAVSATSEVAERSQHIGHRIGEAVMALQIGDITRQRIEHVEYAMAILDTSTPSPCTEAMMALSGPERRRLVALCCRLQSAQLSDAVREFDQEIERIFASLTDLTASAGEIARLGEQAYGSSGAGRRTFLLDLEDDVGQARLMLEGFRTARVAADTVVESVRDATDSLAAHIGSIRSLESEIRIMGLNTTLKCGRLGNAGRPLSVIAQELRACSHVAAVEADSIMVSVEHMTASVGALSSQDQSRHTTDIVAIADAMTSSVDRLGTAGHNLGDALTALRRDSDKVCALLRDTAARITVHQEIGIVLRQAATDLDAIVGDDELATDLSPAEEGVLAHIASAYTMAREREVHSQIMRGTSTAALATGQSSDGAALADALDDILF